MLKLSEEERKMVVQKVAEGRRAKLPMKKAVGAALDHLRRTRKATGSAPKDPPA